MKCLSVKKLAEVIKSKRHDMNFTQEQLSNATGINRIIIERIERMNFTPSIVLLESLSCVLHFEITDLFVEREDDNLLVTLKNETISNEEKEGIEKLFTMMLSLKQQLVLRGKFENE